MCFLHLPSLGILVGKAAISFLGVPLSAISAIAAHDARAIARQPGRWTG